MRTWLLVASDRREFDGIRKRLGSSPLHWSVGFACESQVKGDRWVMVANGAGCEAAGLGARVATRLLESEIPPVDLELAGIVSTGFCGALDPALRLGDIVEENLLCSDRVAVTASEKASLRERTGASAVEMESSGIAQWAREYGVPFRSIRAVSDIAGENLPLDFNLYRDARGNFSRSRIALEAILHPFQTIPGLLKLERNCRVAADSLGEFFVHCRL